MAQDLPNGISPQFCKNMALPGGPWIEMTTEMTKPEFQLFIENLSKSQVRRHGELACKTEGLRDNSTAYFESYDGLFIRVEWANNQTTYRGTDLIQNPCTGEK